MKRRTSSPVYRVDSLSVSMRKLAVDSRGASMIEYALMLFMVLVVAAVAVNTLGKTTRSGVDRATIAF